MRVGPWALPALFFLAHFAFHPVWSSFAMGPDLIAAAVVLSSLRLAPLWAGTLGFGAGLLESSMSLVSLWPTVLAFTLVGTIVARVRTHFWGVSPMLMTLAYVGCFWVLYASRTAAADDPAPSLVYVLHAPVSAFATTLLVWVTCTIDPNWRQQ